MIHPIEKVRSAYELALAFSVDHEEAYQVAAAALGIAAESVREAVEIESTGAAAMLRLMDRIRGTP